MTNGQTIMRSTKMEGFTDKGPYEWYLLVYTSALRSCQCYHSVQVVR